MKSPDRTLLRAIYLIAVSIGIMLIGYLLSGGQGDHLTAFLIYGGMLLFAVGTFIGFLGFSKENNDDDKKE